MRDAGAGIDSALGVSLGWSCDVCFHQTKFPSRVCGTFIPQRVETCLAMASHPAVGSHSQLSVSVRISGDHIRGIFG